MKYLVIVPEDSTPEISKPAIGNELEPVAFTPYPSVVKTIITLQIVCKTGYLLISSASGDVSNRT